jgi:hypothetical protein
MVSNRRGASRLGWVLGWAAGVGGLLLPWWRNHAWLRDFYDYGLVMAAVGRMEAGERPYVDFQTPIQTLHFLLAQGAERIWGARYLSLTYANAIAMVAVFGLLAWWLRRRWGGGIGLWVAGAVVVASFGQHTIVWHNALGVAWLAVAMWGMATLPERGWKRVAQIGVVWGALWLGGMTKVTYQVAALAFVVLFTARAVWRREMSMRAGAVMGAGVVGFGVVAPVWTEMVYTGASVGVWRENVLGLAASRSELLLRVLRPEFYWRTPHDYYLGANFPFVGGWGVVLVAAVAWGLWRAMRAEAERRRERGWLVVAAGGAVVCGVVLLATNFEIAQVSGAAWLVLATGLVLAFGRGGAARRVLAVGAVTLLLSAWWTAWTGARALWGRGELDRGQFVSADGLPSRYAYLEGTRIEAGVRESLLGFDEFVAGRDERAMYFVHGAEWMVRAAPAARHRGLPLWLHEGTTYSDENAWRINTRLAHGGGIELVWAFETWNHWHFGAAEMLAQTWSGPRRVGPHLMVYELEPAVEGILGRPVELAEKTGSNVDARRTRAEGGEVELRIRKDGAYLEQRDGGAWGLDFPMGTLRGEMVAELTEPVAGDVSVVLRVTENGAGGRVLAERRVGLSNRASAWIGSFEVEGGAGGVRLETEVGDARARAGWRTLRTGGAEVIEAVAPGPLDVGLKALAAREEWGGALGVENAWREMAVFGIDAFADEREGRRELFVHVPGEVWLRVAGEARVSGEVGLREHAWSHPESLPGVIARVVWVKSGRLEVLWKKELRPKTRAADREPQEFAVEVPERGGWVALTMVSADATTNAWGHGWWRGVRVETEARR